LYFRFHRGIRAALLQAHAGFTAGDDPGAMSFPLFDDEIARALSEARMGRVARLSRCEPLAKLVLARLGVAHFEAWTVTGYDGAAGAAGRSPVLLGILVAVQAGADASHLGEALERLAGAAGGLIGTGTETIPASTRRGGVSAQPGIEA
jgi:hypothetical protein